MEKEGGRSNIKEVERRRKGEGGRRGRKERGTGAEG